MRKNKKPNNLRITNKNLKVAIGTFICLISIFCMLNFGYVSGFIFWCVSFFIGSLFSYIFYILLFLYGLKFIFQKKFTIRNFNLLIIGLAIISVGVLAITTNQISYFEGEALNFSNFKEAFIKSLNLNNFPKLDIDQSGGILGLTLVAILNSAFTTLGTTIFSGILIGAGTLLLLARPFIYLIHTFKADKTDISLNEQAIIEFNDNGNSLDEDTILTRDGNDEYVSSDDSSNLVEPAFTSVSTEEDNIDEEEEKPIEKQDDPVTPMYETYESNENENIGGLQKVRFNPTFVPESNESNDKVDDFEEEKEMKPVSTFVPTIEDEYKPEDLENNDVVEEINDEPTFENTPVVQSKLDFENQIEDNDSIEDLNDSYEDDYSYEEPVNDSQTLNDNSCQDTLNYEQPKPVSVPVPPIIDDIREREPEVKKDEEPLEKVGPFTKLPKNYKKYINPSIDLLDESKSNDEVEAKNIAICEERTAKINDLLQDFKIGARIVSYKIGPSVTRYDLETERNVSIQGLNKYMNDIAKRLGGLEARFVPIIQGKTTSGIEIANKNRAMVSFRDVYENLPPVKPGKLIIPFGVNISGDHISADLANFPHMLVCGTTGSGKSIYIHSVILSLIMRQSMDDIRLIMVDPKCVEFTKYAKIPHLLCPIITEPAEANITLVKLVDEMEERFRTFSDAGVSNIEQYNEVCIKNHYKKLPYIILIIDEFADLIEQSKQVAQPIARLGSKARAAGIHMIIATQRPSTDVITGTIKSNLAVRVALMTSSPTDSVVVLGEGGAEKLLGNGDMLVNCPLVSKQEKTRVQGCYVSNQEIVRVTNYLEENYPLNFDDKFVNLLEKSRLEASDLGTLHSDQGDDNTYEMIKEHVMKNKETCSISYITHTFHVGYNKGAIYFNRLIAENILERPEYSNCAKGAKVLVHLAGYKDPHEEPVTPGSYSQSTFKAD